MGKNDTLFMTQNGWNPTLWACTYLYSPYKEVPRSTGFDPNKLADQREYPWELEWLIKLESLESNALFAPKICLLRYM